MLRLSNGCPVFSIAIQITVDNHRSKISQIHFTCLVNIHCDFKIRGLLKWPNYSIRHRFVGFLKGPNLKVEQIARFLCFWNIPGHFKFYTFIAWFTGICPGLFGLGWDKNKAVWDYFPYLQGQRTCLFEIENNLGSFDHFKTLF